MRRTVSTLVSAVAVLSAATGCGSEDDREVLVLAASSLTDVFTMMEADFEAAHPDIDVTVSFADERKASTADSGIVTVDYGEHERGCNSSIHSVASAFISQHRGAAGKRMDGGHDAAFSRCDVRDGCGRSFLSVCCER